jgi:hypothetical protein
MLPDAGRHAYGYFHKTLCGIEKPDMTGSQFGMWGGGYRDECPDRTAAALPSTRGGPRNDVTASDWTSQRHLGPGPRDDPGYVRPVDELGRPDIRLPQTLTSPKTRVLGARSPADFLALIDRANLHRCLDREGGGAWTDVTGPLPSPVDPADRMVPFFRDQQSRIMWYLYLHHSGQAAVVCSDRDFTVEPGLRYGPDGEIVLPRREIFWTAPSVEIFAYRFLAEARLTLAIHEKQRAGELDPELLAHLAHCVPSSSSEGCGRMPR